MKRLKAHRYAIEGRLAMNHDFFIRIEPSPTPTIVNNLLDVIKLDREHIEVIDPHLVKCIQEITYTNTHFIDKEFENLIGQRFNLGKTITINENKHLILFWGKDWAIGDILQEISQSKYLSDYQQEIIENIDIVPIPKDMTKNEFLNYFEFVN